MAVVADILATGVPLSVLPRPFALSESIWE